MADVFTFIHQGWKNLWKHRLVWLYSALPLLSDALRVLYREPDQNLFRPLLMLASAALSFISFIAVRYLVYSFSTGQTVNGEDTLFATGKFAGRILGCSCLGFLILLPAIFLAIGLSLDTSTQPPQLSNHWLLLFLLLSIFSSLLDFVIFGFFANDWGIWQSFKNAWAIFTAHFAVLALLGIILTVITRTHSAVSAALTVLIQSGFDPISVTTLNYLHPFPALDSNMLFLLLNGVGQTIFLPFSASVFVLAYLKYNR